MSKTLISIEGLDGSGKATQTQCVVDRLRSQNVEARKISFPDYDSPSSALVKMYLNREISDDLKAINPYAASSFYAADRYASYMKDWSKDYNDGKIIVADRYTDSNAIHQTCKLQPDEYDSFLEWMYDYEYNKLGIPKTDLVIFLNVSPNVSQKLMSQRYGNDESKKDIHESNLDYLNKCREVSFYISKKYGWKIINCDDGYNMKSISDITDEIMKEIKKVI